MSQPNRVPLPRPFAICFGCDIVEALTTAAEDGWALVFRHHRMFGYLCPSCQQSRVSATIVPQQSRSEQESQLPA